jgi:pimeloyl-ACP methyl ester carboxylesterase
VLQQLGLAALRAIAERGARVGWAATPGGAVRFAVRGPEGAQPLLILHGLGDSLAGWAQVAGPLAQRYRVHLIDLPGHGLSHKPPDWRLRTLEGAVAHYARDLRDPVLVGHSLGGWLALRLFPSEVIKAMWTEAAQGLLGAISEEDFLLEAQLSGLRVALRLVWGARDRLLPEGTLAFFQRALPNAEVILLDKAGHLPHLEAPGQLAQAILRPRC